MLLPGLTMLTLVILIAIVLVMTGIEKIITGLFISHKSRFLTVGLGILTVILADVVLTFPIVAAIAVIWILGFSLMVDGFSRIADGVTNKSNRKWIRGFTVAVGVLAVIIIAFMIISSPAFGTIFASIIISIALLITGIEMLTTGISGHKNSINRSSVGNDMK
jgi:uncharacterized membrane protein HdeD (DUF308 family)